eukprot:307649_1
MHLCNRFVPKYFGYLYLTLCFYINIINCESPLLSTTPTIEPTMEPTTEPTLHIITVSNTETHINLDDQTDTNGKGPISYAIDKLFKSILPWTIQVDYIFISIIGLLLICLCCCCCCQYHWYLKNQKLKTQVEYAKNKRELKIVRPGTPSFGINCVPSMSHLSERNSLANSEDYLYVDQDDNRSGKFFPMFQPHKHSVIKDKDDDSDENDEQTRFAVQI